MPSNKKWFETWFSHPFYLELYTHRNDEDAKKILNLVLPYLDLKPNSRVLDLACGNGRHTVNLVKYGFSVTGLDLSSSLLGLAKSEAERQHVKAEFIEADMRFFKLSPAFTAIFNLFTSFGFFEDDRENFSVFKNVSDHLIPNGYFIFDYLNADHIKKNLVTETSKKTDKFCIFQNRRIEKDMVKKYVRIEKNDEVLEFEESVKLYPFELIREVLQNFGLEITNTWGDYSGNPLSESAERLILTARKK